jgi:hypothetical protein
LNKIKFLNSENYSRTCTSNDKLILKVDANSSISSGSSSTHSPSSNGSLIYDRLVKSTYPSLKVTELIAAAGATDFYMDKEASSENRHFKKSKLNVINESNPNDDEASDAVNGTNRKAVTLAAAATIQTLKRLDHIRIRPSDDDHCVDQDENTTINKLMEKYLFGSNLDTSEKSPSLGGKNMSMIVDGNGELKQIENAATTNSYQQHLLSFYNTSIQDRLVDANASNSQENSSNFIRDRYYQILREQVFPFLSQCQQQWSPTATPVSLNNAVNKPNQSNDVLY